MANATYPHPDGKTLTARYARKMSCETALSGRMNPNPLARAMRRNPGVDRRVTTRFVDPATLR